MEQYNITGMSCAACSARVEKAVSQVEGVTACSVSLLTNSMGVEGTASPEAMLKFWRYSGLAEFLMLRVMVSPAWIDTVARLKPTVNEPPEVTAEAGILKYRLSPEAMK